jgi:ABC-type enterochelin transport system substrate-binding protein
VAAAALLAALAGCSTGTSCDDLAALTAERDAARQEWTRLEAGHAKGEATEQQVEAAHEQAHVLDTRVYDLAQKCGD